jgi:hypothetical protein
MLPTEIRATRFSKLQSGGGGMGNSNARIDAARKTYREALDAARASPTPEAWAKLLAAGKELSSAEEPRPRSRRGRRPAQPPVVENPEPAEGTLE